MAHVFIVEDETHIAQMISATLALGGHTSECCEDGSAAPQRIREGHFDLVLLDIMLPGLDGFQIMELIQDMDVPVIFLPAMQQVADKVRGLRSGAEDYIVKPFYQMCECAVLRSGSQIRAEIQETGGVPAVRPPGSGARSRSLARFGFLMREGYGPTGSETTAFR